MRGGEATRSVTLSGIIAGLRAVAVALENLQTQQQDISYIKERTDRIMASIEDILAAQQTEKDAIGAAAQRVLDAIAAAQANQTDPAKLQEALQNITDETTSIQQIAAAPAPTPGP